MKYTTPYFCTNVNNVRTPFFQILVRMFCKNVFFFQKRMCCLSYACSSLRKYSGTICAMVNYSFELAPAPVFTASTELRKLSSLHSVSWR